MNNKLYVITRTDLSIPQQAVQAGHALAEFLLTQSTDWDNGTLVYLKVNDEIDLKCLTHELNYSRIPYVEFEEPDRDNELTALASLGTNEFFQLMDLL